MKFVTIATEDFTPGVLTLIKSMEVNAGLKFDFTVIKLDEFSEETMQKFNQLQTNVEFFAAQELGQFEFDEELLEDNHRTLHQKKFLIYKLPYNEKMCYLDSDLLCLNDISDIEDFEPLTVAPNIGREDPETINNRPMFNSGLMIFQPSKQRFQELQEFAHQYDQKMMYGDQRLLNEYYLNHCPEEVNYLGFNWNVMITSKRFRPNLYKKVQEEGIKFLHFTSFKPWIYQKPFPELIKRDEKILDKSIINKAYKRIKYRNEIIDWEVLSDNSR